MKQAKKERSVPEAVEKVFDLVVPERALVLDVFFLGKIGHNQDCLVGNLGFFNPELEIFTLGGVQPAELDEFVVFTFQDFGLLKSAAPSKIKDIITLVYLVCEPLPKACRSRKELIKN